MNNLLKRKNFWKNRKVFITGHTGFKGTWLSFTLKLLGAKVYGYSLNPPTNPNLFNIIKLKNLIDKSIIADVRDKKKLFSNLKKIKPEVIFHLAAQPLVIDSYQKPYETFVTNFIGTLNILDCANKIKSIKCNIIVTTDKVYKTAKKNIYKETDELGVTDPYGSSKVTSEIVTESYVKSIENQNLKHLKSATVRAGNVVGGGDYSKNRLIPDFLKSLKSKKKMIIRNPGHVRPWQFVMEPIYGYILLSEKILKKEIKKKDYCWNFAPKIKNCIKVLKFINLLNNNFNNKIKILKSRKIIIEKETKYLLLDNKKSKKYLKWKNIYNITEIILMIKEWNKINFKKLISSRNIMKKQILEYIAKN